MAKYAGESLAQLRTANRELQHALQEARDRLLEETRRGARGVEDRALWFRRVNAGAASEGGLLCLSRLYLFQGQQLNAEASQRPHSRENEGVWALVGLLSSEIHVRSSRRFRTTR